MIGVGEQFGAYTILQRLGRGGMGEVYLAQHRFLARRAAVKVLIPELSQNPTVLSRFFNEARATSQIRHRGIVEVLDCDVIDGQAFIVMEFLEGESAGGYLHRAGPLSQDVVFALGIGMAVASGVGAAHATGIIHRDLKPDNIYLHLDEPNDPYVTVKILDFGIAKLVQQGQASQTGTGTLLGTPVYMSPEQCKGAGSVDGRSDVYSLGCILYESLTGRPPFVHEGMGELIVAHISEQPEPMASRVPHLAAPLDALVLRMLAKKPEARQQSMEEVVTDIRACALTLGLNVDLPMVPVRPVQRPALPAESGPVATSFTGSSRWGSTPPGIARPPSSAGISPQEAAATAAGGLVPQTGAREGEARPRRLSAPVEPLSGPSVTGGEGRPRRQSAPMEPLSGPSATAAERSRRAQAPMAAMAGGTRVLDAVSDSEPRQPTTLGSSAAELRRPPARPATGGSKWLMVGGGGVLVLGGVVAFLATRSAPTVSSDPDHGAAMPGPGNLAGSDQRRAEPPGNRTDKTDVARPPDLPPAKPPSPAEPEMVRIDLSGVPPKTVVLVDGRPSLLPVRVPAGPDKHKILLRPPTGPERTVEVDGTQDRTIAVTFESERPVAAAPKRPAPEPAAGRPRGGGAGSSPRGGAARGGGARPSEAVTAPQPAGRPGKDQAITDI
jgi:serine/threonine protein kinase